MQIYNPFLPLNDYIADGEPHVFGERVYIFGSHDKEGGEAFCMLDYVAYSAPVTNLKDWRFEGVIYRKEQDPNANGKRKYMYAPDVVQGVDGRYYLFYTLEGFAGPISVAVCNTPAGKYEYHGDVRNADGSKFLRYIPFDPAVINDNGIVRLYYGWSLHLKKPQNPIEKIAINKVMSVLFSKSVKEIQSEPLGVMGANTVELCYDMLTVRTEPKRIIPAQMDAAGTPFDGHAFYEASSIRKIGESYYFIFSSKLNHELCYATSSYPDKDFEYRGVIISNGDVGYNGRKEKERLNTTGNNHGSIECINGKWYIFYHRHTHLTTYSRQACAEPIVINDDGSINQVEMTSCGLNGAPLVVDGEFPAVIACIITDGNMPHIVNGKSKSDKPHITHENETRFITKIKDGTKIGFKYFDFSGMYELSVKIRGGCTGKFIISTDDGNKAEIPITKSNDWQQMSTKFTLNGIYPLYLTFKGKGKVELLSIEFKEQKTLC